MCHLLQVEHIEQFDFFFPACGQFFDEMGRKLAKKPNIKHTTEFKSIMSPVDRVGYVCHVY